MSDPYVWETSHNNTNRIRDCREELSYNVTGVNSDKKIVILLWWWNPNETNPEDDANYDTLYNYSFDLVKNDVNGIGGFNFSGSGKRLDTSAVQQIIDLWAEIKTNNASV